MVRQIRHCTTSSIPKIELSFSSIQSTWLKRRVRHTVLRNRVMFVTADVPSN